VDPVDPDPDSDPNPQHWLSLAFDLKSKVGNITSGMNIARSIRVSIKKWSRYSYVALMNHCLEKKVVDLDVLSPDSVLTKIYTAYIQYLLAILSFKTCF
jgi:hypothetical protein